MVAGGRLRLATLVLGLGATILIGGRPALGAEASPGALSDYQVKAAYLYYFSTFVDWPAEAFAQTGNELVIGVLGEDPFGGILDDTLRGKSVNNRRIVVRRLRLTSPPVASTPLAMKTIVSVFAAVQKKNAISHHA